ncbi:MAG: hypothetical protein HKN92_05145 [Chitinophagales bacterium]|nr:hypothetical protein [Chitinophagales bacterium]
MKLRLIPICLLLLSVLSFDLSAQDDDIYESGTVWNVTMVRIDANMEDKYLKNLSNTWKMTMDEAKKQGLILDYKVLLGSASNGDDFNLMLMVENKNMAAYDPNPEREAKWDAIQEAMIAKVTQEGFDETLQLYTNIRELLGSKLMREITLN